jgi:hypothetical protein
MNMRLLPILGITGLFSIALAGSAGAGGGWPPAPGTYKMKDISANASLAGPLTTICTPKGCFPQPSEFAYVNVDRGLHTFKPRGGETLVQQSGTMLNLSLYTTSGPGVNGCWIIADSDFIVAENLSSASLLTTVPAASNCPGTPLAVSSTNVVTPKGGGGGGGGGGTEPITLNVSWTYKGVVSHSQDEGELVCGSFKTKSAFDLDHATAVSQGQITGASATLTADFASIDNSSSKQVVKGTPLAACFS